MFMEPLLLTSSSGDIQVRRSKDVQTREQGLCTDVSEAVCWKVFGALHEAAQCCSGDGYLPDRVINLALQYLSTRYAMVSVGIPFRFLSLKPPWLFLSMNES